MQTTFDKLQARLMAKRYEGEAINPRLAKRWANALLKVCNKYKGKHGKITAKARRQTHAAARRVYL